MKEKWNDLNPNAKVTVVVIIVLALFAILLLLLGPRKKHYKYSPSDFKEIKSSILNDYNTFSFVNNKVNFFLQVDDNKYTYNLLDTSYIKNNGVNASNALEKTGKKNKNLGLHLKNVRKININDDVITYYVKGYLYNNPDVGETFLEGEDKVDIINDNYKILFTVDYKNMTTSFYPDINDKQVIEILNSKRQYYIKTNKNNKLTESPLMTDYEVCLLYYQDITFKMKNLKEQSYYNLNKSFRNKFSDKKDYEKYLDKYFSDYPYSLQDCKNGQSKKELFIYDMEGNVFSLEIRSVLDYTFIIS